MLERVFRVGIAGALHRFFQMLTYLLPAFNRPRSHVEGYMDVLVHFYEGGTRSAFCALLDLLNGAEGGVGNQPVNRGRISRRATYGKTILNRLLMRRICG